MKLSAFSQKKWIYALIAFLIPFTGILTVMIISKSAPFGDQSVLYSDMYHQYYPFFVQFRRALLSGESLLYSWNVGLGMDYLGLISYYLASPLYLLCVLIPENWMLGYFSLLIPVKLGFAGMFFAIFLKDVFKKNDFAIPFFASFYALCAWAMGYQWNIMWLDTFALLPLVMLGAIKLLSERKFILYTISLFVSIFANYYIGLFVCIFVLLAFICYEICCWEGFRKLYIDLFMMAVCSVLAIGMTAILELPALAALQNTHSSVNKFPTGFKLNIADKATITGLLDAMRQVAGNMNGGITPTFKEGLPNLYCGVGTILLSFLFLTSKEVRIRDKICSALLLLFFSLSFIIRQLDYIWHGFHFTNMIPYRFSFLFSFCLLVMAYRAYILRNSFKLWQVLVSSALSIGIMFCALGDTSLKYWAYNIAFIVLFAGLFILCTRSEAVNSTFGNVVKKPIYSKRMLSFAMCFILSMEVIINLANFAASFGGASVKNYPKGTSDTIAVVEQMQNIETDSLFYRAETTHSQTLNDAALIGYNGISTFTSSANAEVTQLMKQLGYGAMRSYNRYCYEESSPVANLFLNIKYLIERDGNVQENAYYNEVYSSGQVHLLKNKAYLPLGFLTSSQIINVDVSEETNPFVFQNNLFSSATDIEEDVWTFIPGSQLQISAPGGHATTMPMSGYCSYNLTDQTENKTISYIYTVENEGFMCFYVNQTKKNAFNVIVNGTKIYSETYSIPQMLSVCDVSAGDIVEIQFNCKKKEQGSISVLAATVNEPIFNTGYNLLTKSKLEIKEFRNTKITGTVTCGHSGVLYTSIPQDGNWVVYVNGKEANIVKIGNVMVGVLLPEGTHKITFCYRNKAFYLGAGISSICLICFVSISLLYYYSKRKYPKGKYERH